MFVRKAEAYPKWSTREVLHTGWLQIRLKKRVQDKHSSLFAPLQVTMQKSFITLTQGHTGKVQPRRGPVIPGRRWPRQRGDGHHRVVRILFRHRSRVRPDAQRPAVLAPRHRHRRHVRHRTGTSFTKLFTSVIYKFS
jgi:hypothetical protein